MEQHALKM